MTINRLCKNRSKSSSHSRLRKALKLRIQAKWMKYETNSADLMLYVVWKLEFITYYSVRNIIYLAMSFLMAALFVTLLFLLFALFYGFQHSMFCTFHNCIKVFCLFEIVSFYAAAAATCHIAFWLNLLIKFKLHHGLYPES